MLSSDVFAQREEPPLQPCLDVDPSHKSPRPGIPKALPRFALVLIEIHAPEQSGAYLQRRSNGMHCRALFSRCCPLISSRTDSARCFMAVHRKTDVPESILGS
jgi:hypothetical protein